MDGRTINICVLGAGRAERFQGAFKPFVRLADLSFLEACLEPYSRVRGESFSFYLVATRNQEVQHDVCARARELWPNITCVIIPFATAGPLASASAAIQIEPALRKRTIFTDCDHAVDPEPLLSCIASGAPRIASYWRLDDDTDPKWSRFDKMEVREGRLLVLERRAAHAGGVPAMGIVGCYYLEDASVLSTYASEAHFPALIQKLSWDVVEINEASFFGEPAAVLECLAGRREQHTAFVDIDGVVLRQLPNASTDASENEIIPATLESLREFRMQGNRVVLVTARSSVREQAVVAMLAEMNIPYDDILFDCKSGQRFLVNDIKPALPSRPQAVAVNVERDEGLHRIPVDTCTVLQEFEGHSFATTRLLRQGTSGPEFVRKTAPRGPAAQVLRRQVEELRRLNFYSADIAPAVLGEGEDDRVFWFDLQFCRGYRPLSECALGQQISIARLAVRCLRTHVYKYRGEASATYMNDFLSNHRIHTKLAAAEELPGLKSPARGIRELLRDEARIIKSFSPTHLHPIHGDLTLENILCNNAGEWKLIDPAGSFYMDTRLSDLGKLFQSFVCGYRDWGSGYDAAGPELISSEWPEAVVAEFVEDDTYDQTLLAGMFHLGAHLIRMYAHQMLRAPARGALSLRLAHGVLAALLSDRPRALVTPRTLVCTPTFWARGEEEGPAGIAMRRDP